MTDLPKCPQKYPYVLDMEPGRYWWCSCGLSKEQPFCDGSHKGTKFSPVKVEITEAQTIAWCGCKKSEDGHLCDGTHKKL